MYRAFGSIGYRLERHYALSQLARLEARGARLGSDIRVFGRFTFQGDPQNLEIGDGTTINEGAVLNAAGPLTLGRDVRVSNLAQIQTAELSLEDRSAHRVHHFLPVTVGDTAWIAAGAIIVPGVSVGAGAILAAGAVVLDNVPAWTLVAGVPARVVRELPRG